MKYLPLIWAGLWRKWPRTVFTAVSVLVSFVLFGIMQGVAAGLDDAIAALTDDTRLITQSRINLIEPLPLAALPQIREIDGIRDVAYYGYFGGYFRETRNQLNVGAVNVDTFLDVYPEFLVSRQQRESMARTRNGALVGRELADRFEWAEGDRIPLRSTLWRQANGSDSWEFEIAGIFTSRGEAVPTDYVYLNYEYFDEARTHGNGTVALYMARIDDPSRDAEISEAIDALFVNSANETHTQNEQGWTRAQVARIGDVGFFVNAIVSAVVFTLLFLTGHTMIQSVHERKPEFAVLKTVGYGGFSVVALVFAESLILCGGAALAGLGLAALVFPRVFESMGLFALALPQSVVELGLAIAVLLALLSALPSAWQAQRLSIAAALGDRVQ